MGYVLPHMTPQGAQCFQHPDTSAVGTCARCGTFFCSACTSDGRHCSRCQQMTLQPGDIGQRFLANLADSAVISGPAIVVIIVGMILGLALVQDEDKRGIAIILAMVAGGFAMTLGLAVQAYFQFKYGRSVGKWLCSLRVVRMDGSAVDPWRVIFMRNVLVQFIAQFCGLVALIDPLLIFREDRRCLHDHIADTMVVYDPKTPL